VTKVPGQTKPKVTLSLTDATLCLQEPGEKDIPREHELIVASVSHQTIGAFSVETDPVTGGDRVRMEGKVQQRLECRPFADKSYLQLKVEEMKKVSQPARQVIALDRAVNNYKPVADHKHNVRTCRCHLFNSRFHLLLCSKMINWFDWLPFCQIAYEEKKKAEGKKSRDDKDKVLEMLFNAFEKHQYYNLKDLVRLTNQPVVSAFLNG